MSKNEASREKAMLCQSPRQKALPRWASPFLSLAMVALSCATVLHAQVTFAGAQTTVPVSYCFYNQLGVQICGETPAAPNGVAVDAAGDVFVADTGHNRVVELPAGGGAPTVVGYALTFPGGLPLADPTRVAVDAAGDVFIADSGNNRIVKVPAGGGALTTVGAG